MSNQEFKQEKNVYWKNLITLYNSTSTMSVVLVNEDCQVQVKIAHAIPGKEHERPQAGVQKYDYANSMFITLSLSEIATLVAAYRFNMLNGATTFFHTVNGNKCTGGILSDGSKASFTIKDLGRNANVNYTFNATKVGMTGQERYIPSELFLFMETLAGVINNMVFIKSGLMKPYERSTNSNPAYNKQQSYIPQVNIPTQPVQQTMPAPQPQPQYTPQQPSFPQSNGLPQSVNSSNPGVSPIEYDSF